MNGTSGNPPALEVNNLCIELAGPNGTARVVDDVSFSVAPQRTLGIVGESGSGKSMTVKAVMGLLPRRTAFVSGGTIAVNGTRLDSLTATEERRLRGRVVSMIFQDPLSALNPVMTVGDQIGEVFRIHRRYSRGKARKEAISLMSQLGIPAAERRVRDYPHQLSGGMRQRAMIAMAIALRPSVLIADEPTTALDVTIQYQIITLLKQLQDEYGMALVFISHDLNLVADIADDVAVMYAGRIIERGTIQNIYQAPSHPYTAALMAAMPRLGANDELSVIPGSPASPFAAPSGCAFHPRCRFARDICITDKPAVRTVSSGSESACHFAEEFHDLELVARGESL